MFEDLREDLMSYLFAPIKLLPVRKRLPEVSIKVRDQRLPLH